MPPQSKHHLSRFKERKKKLQLFREIFLFTNTPQNKLTIREDEQGQKKKDAA
jgi:hypothetical protein